MSSNKNDSIKLICPVCGEEMTKYEYGYDNNVHGKVYFKCNYCGHKKVKYYNLILSLFSFFLHKVLP